MVVNWDNKVDVSDLARCLQFGTTLLSYSGKQGRTAKRYFEPKDRSDMHRTQNDGFVSRNHAAVRVLLDVCKYFVYQRLLGIASETRLLSTTTERRGNVKGLQQKHSAPVYWRR